MKRFCAFFIGMREFRSDVTTHYNDFDLLEINDKGRDLAHRLTFRYYDHNR